MTVFQNFGLYKNLRIWGLVHLIKLADLRNNEMSKCKIMCPPINQQKVYEDVAGLKKSAAASRYFARVSMLIETFVKTVALTIVHCAGLLSLSSKQRLLVLAITERLLLRSELVPQSSVFYQ
jgi:hypothetical protein